MAYLTSTDVGNLSAIPTALLAEIDAGVVTAACAAFTAEANSYFATRYPIPITTPGSDIKQRGADIVAYRLMSRHGYQPTGSDVDFRQRYEDAMQWLRDVARGLATLDLAVTAPSPTRFARVISRAPRGW